MSWKQAYGKDPEVLLGYTRLRKIADVFIYKSTSKNEYFSLQLRCYIKLSDRVGNSLCGSVEHVHPVKPPILEAVAKKAT